MTTTCKFVLPLAPMPTPRPRARVIAVPGRRPLASFYSPKEYKEWQKQAAKLLAEDDWMQGRPPFGGPVSVSLVITAEKPRTTKLPHPKPDVDNYAKAVLDALTADGRFWADDSQVQALAVRKEWGGGPSISVTIETL